MSLREGAAGSVIVLADLRSRRAGAWSHRRGVNDELGYPPRQAVGKCPPRTKLEPLARDLVAHSRLQVAGGRIWRFRQGSRLCSARMQFAGQAAGNRDLKLQVLDEITQVSWSPLIKQPGGGNKLGSSSYSSHESLQLAWVAASAAMTEFGAPAK